jgi:phosphate:Na+ symporter
MALTLVMVNQGWISFEMGAAMVLGENIGTTITANIAAAVGDVNGKRAAIAHTLFNIFGVIWVLILFNPFLLLNRTLTELLGEFNPLIGLSMFHSLFNATNTMVLVWFIPMIERMVTKIIPDRTTKRDKTRLRYISGGPVATPELGASQALLETIHFAQVSRNEITLIDNAVQNLNTPDFEEHRNQLVRYEEIADNIEKEISAFLNKLTEYKTSLETSKMINALYRIISEIERLGDSGESISRILARMKTRNIVLSEERKQGISKMLNALQDAYDTMISNLRSATRPNMDNFDGEAAIENEMAINILRNRLRDEEFARLEENGITDYVASNLYLDVIVEIERMGDFIINISQALEE